MAARDHRGRHVAGQPFSCRLSWQRLLPPPQQLPCLPVDGKAAQQGFAPAVVDPLVPVNTGTHVTLALPGAA